MAQENFKTGTVAIIGAPNVGKSTLLNTILQTKIAIVTPKPHTTQTNILGIYTAENLQVIFIDTPGIHRSKGKFENVIVSNALSVLSDVDLLLFLVEAKRKIVGEVRFTKEEALISDRLKRIKTPVIIGLNKVDRLAKVKLLPQLDFLNRALENVGLVPISALENDGVDILLGLIAQNLPVGAPLYGKDQITDRTLRFLCQELVREKVILMTAQEVPYAIRIEIESFIENEKDGVTVIAATIYVEKDSQKGILIGQRGQMIKEIGTLARLDMEALLEQKVYLELFVKVRRDWKKEDALLKGLQS